MPRTARDEEAAPQAAEAASGRARLPLSRLLAFTTAGFLAIMTETMPAGLLPRISAGLHVTEGAAGQFVTVYAVGSVVAAVPVIAATRGVRRRPLLLLAVAGLLVFNSVTALSPRYGLTLAARFAAGTASGVVWGLLAGYGRRLVPEHLQGRALAVVGVGQPVALTLGVPLGTWLGSLVGWRGVFWVMSAVAVVLVVWIRTLVPDFPGQPAAERLPLRRILTLPGVRPVLAVVFLWIAAHNTLYTYIAPFLGGTGLAARVDVALLVFGAAAVAGIWLTGTLIDRRLRTVTLVCALGFAFAALLLGTAGGSAPLLLGGIAAWGVTFGGAPTLLQTALADAAEGGADAAQSLFVTVFNAAVAGGGAAGGVLLSSVGVSALPWVLVALALLSAAVVAAARGHAFPPGARGR